MQQPSSARLRTHTRRSHHLSYLVTPANFVMSAVMGMCISAKRMVYDCPLPGQIQPYMPRQVCCAYSPRREQCRTEYEIVTLKVTDRLAMVHDVSTDLPEVQE